MTDKIKQLAEETLENIELGASGLAENDMHLIEKFVWEAAPKLAKEVLRLLDLVAQQSKFLSDKYKDALVLQVRSRNQALEEAAEVARKYKLITGEHVRGFSLQENIAEAIRALKEE